MPVSGQVAVDAFAAVVLVVVVCDGAPELWWEAGLEEQALKMRPARPVTPSTVRQRCDLDGARLGGLTFMIEVSS